MRTVSKPHGETSAWPRLRVPSAPRRGRRRRFARSSPDRSNARVSG
ncbi:hypothetical protein [Lysobacter gummosus]